MSKHETTSQKKSGRKDKNSGASPASQQAGQSLKIADNSEELESLDLSNGGLVSEEDEQITFED